MIVLRGKGYFFSYIKISSWANGHVRFFYNPSFFTCFFSQNSIFLSQQISRNSVSACFFNEANGAHILYQQCAVIIVIGFRD